MSLRLWKYNRITGLWDYQRAVTEDTKLPWLRVFTAGEPFETFKVCTGRPRGNPKGAR